MAHGYFLFGSFAEPGPLRNTDKGDLVGLIAAIALVIILSVCLFSYGQATFSTNKPAKGNLPDNLKAPEPWSQFSGGFVIGGVGGAIFAYLLLTNFSPIRLNV